MMMPQPSSLSLTPLLLKSQTQIFSLIPNSPFSTFPPLSPLSTQNPLIFARKPLSLSLPTSLNSFSNSIQTHPQQHQQDDEEHVIGDCLVFEEDIFEDPYLQYQSDSEKPIDDKPVRRKPNFTVKEEDLIPDKWKEVQAEINITKKERRKIAQEIEFGSKVEMKKKVVPLTNTTEYLTYREHKMKQLKQVVLDNPSFDSEDEAGEDDGGGKGNGELGCSSSGRVAPRNPRAAVYKGSSLDDITEFFNSGNYAPGGESTGKNSEGRRKLFTQEEKSLLNKRIPNLDEATCKKWLPLHTLAASGEFYLVDALLKYDVNINATDGDGLTALHKAILCKKMAVTNYLLRESANPFIRDKEGATLMHYAVLTASSPTIKILLLYNVDINLADDDGWTPLHLAVQTRRTDIVKLLLIKGADKTLKNRDGLTPLDLCLYFGRHVRTYELIRLLKQLPKSPPRLTGYQLT